MLKVSAVSVARRLRHVRYIVSLYGYCSFLKGRDELMIGYPSGKDDVILSSRTDTLHEVVDGHWQKQRANGDVREGQACDEKIRYVAKIFIFEDGKKHQRITEGSDDTGHGANYRENYRVIFS